MYKIYKRKKLWTKQENCDIIMPYLSNLNIEDLNILKEFLFDLDNENLKKVKLITNKIVLGKSDIHI